jgi:hypothetical protein
MRDLTLGLPGVPPGRAAVPGSAGAARPGGVAVHPANRQETPLSASQRSFTKIAGCRHQEPISGLPEHPKAGLLFTSRFEGDAGEEVEHGKLGPAVLLLAKVTRKGGGVV